jgi:hypothetical protein
MGAAPPRAVKKEHIPSHGLLIVDDAGHPLLRVAGF